MNTFKLLSCGCLISLLGCAGSDSAAKPKVNAGDVRVNSSKAFSELEGQNVQATSGNSSSQLQSVAESVSLSEMLNSHACPNADDLRGQGIADNASSALTIAQKDIAAKIQSVVVAKTEETRKSNVDAAGNETLQSSFETNTQVITRLQNAQDARSIATLTQAGKFGVVACMTKSDAAKPFVRESALLQDSVKLALKIFEEQKHPIIRNNAFKAASEMYSRILSIGTLLEGLNVKFDNKVKADFETEQQKYNDFRSQYAFHYQVVNSDASVAPQVRSVFERISAKYPLRVADCTNNGLLLKLDVSPESCSEGSLGIACSMTMNLEGSNCEGESYFSVNAKVKGSGRYDVNEAKERLNENISKGDWFNEWAVELDKWRLE
ncbi:MAG: hypothetical protein IKS97_01230 [Fibrobacter sp.]|nr:hypothetical protein [Fibrobacter sp.]